jgi:uncharacterized protein
MIADTGPIIAWLNREDEHHKWAIGLPQTKPWLTLESCLAEAAWNLGQPGKVAQLVELGLVIPVPLEPEDWRRVTELAARFVDHDIDLVDFAIVRLSGKFRSEKIATVDRDHFTILRRFHRERLPLILP